MAMLKKKKSKSKKTSKLSSIAGKAGKMIGIGGTSSGRRHKKGPIYWQNKVLVEKLKRKYNKLKFGGR